MENWISVRTDIVIPNELILVHYEGGEIEYLLDPFETLLTENGINLQETDY